MPSLDPLYYSYPVTVYDNEREAVLNGVTFPIPVSWEERYSQIAHSTRLTVKADFPGLPFEEIVYIQDIAQTNRDTHINRAVDTLRARITDFLVFQGGPILIQANINTGGFRWRNDLIHTPPDNQRLRLVRYEIDPLRNASPHVTPITTEWAIHREVGPSSRYRQSFTLPATINALDLGRNREVVALWNQHIFRFFQEYHVRHHVEQARVPQTTMNPQPSYGTATWEIDWFSSEPTPWPTPQIEPDNNTDLGASPTWNDFANEEQNRMTNWSSFYTVNHFNQPLPLLDVQNPAQNLPRRFPVRPWPQTEDLRKRELLLQYRTEYKQNINAEKARRVYICSYVHHIVKYALEHHKIIYHSAQRQNGGIGPFSGWITFYNVEDGIWMKFRLNDGYTGIQSINYDSADERWLNTFCYINKNRPSRRIIGALTRRLIAHYEALNFDFLEPRRHRVTDNRGRSREVYMLVPKMLRKAQAELTKPSFDVELWKKEGFRVKYEENNEVLVLTHKFDGFKFLDRFIIQDTIFVRLKFRLKSKKYYSGDIKALNTGYVHPHVNGNSAGQWGHICPGSFNNDFGTAVFEGEPHDLKVLMINFLNAFNKESPYHEICQSGWMAWDLKRHQFVKPSVVCKFGRTGNEGSCTHSNRDQLINHANEEDSEL